MRIHGQARSQYLLQSGHFVGDILCFQGEGAPNSLRYGTGLEPSPPPCYDYDGCDIHVLMNRITVQDGRLVLPNGGSYAVLVRPPTEVMTPQLARRVRRLVSEGALVVGPRPSRSPSLGSFPQCDQDVADIGVEVWGDCDGATVFRHAFGKGAVIWGQSMEKVMADANAHPDARFTIGTAATPIEWLHRRTEDADIYFVANAAQRYQSIVGTFRVSGRQPQLWHPDTGITETAAVTRAFYGIIDDPAQAATLDVTDQLQERVKDGHLVITVNNEIVGDPAHLVVKQLRVEYRLNGAAGTLTVGENHVLRLPADSTDYGLPPAWNLISGTAEYEGELQISPEMIAPGSRLALDLGQVLNFAAVTLNEHRFGVLWKLPFRLDITGAVRAGTNRIRVRVTNLWPTVSSPTQKPWKGKHGQAMAICWRGPTGSSTGRKNLRMDE